MPSKVTSKPAEVADPAIEDTAESTTADTTAPDTVAEPVTAEQMTAEPTAEPMTAEPTAAEPAAVDAAAAGSDDAAPTTARATPRQRRRPSRWTMLVAGLSVLVVALWVAGGLLFAHNRGASQLAAQRQGVVAAAQKVAGDLTSISSSNAQAQIQSLTNESTGGFRDQISTYAQALQAILQQSGAGSQGTVSAAGIERMDANTASVLVAVTATVSNTKLPNAQPVNYRLGVQLQREGDRWLASDVTFVQ
ncbi:MAG: Mce-associated rane protein [Pseudonocardiales bacterium]|nr:Mce-associated rane protein [Pseudonocardiales bacterium]